MKNTPDFTRRNYDDFTFPTAAPKSAGGPELDRRRVQLPGAVKSVGDYKVQVKLHPEVTATFIALSASMVGSS